MKKQTQRSIAHPCYDHLGGSLAALLMEKFYERGWLKLKAGKENAYEITEKGCRGFAEWGIEVSQFMPKEQKQR